MAVIEGVELLTTNLSSNPLKDQLFSVAHDSVNITLVDNGIPTGKFTYGIAGIVLRGLADFMSKNDIWRQLTFYVYDGRFLRGIAIVHGTQ